VRVVTDELDKVAPVGRSSRHPLKTISRWLSVDAVAAKRKRRRLERRWQRTRNENDRLKYWLCRWMASKLFKMERIIASFNVVRQSPA